MATFPFREMFSEGIQLSQLSDVTTKLQSKLRAQLTTVILKP